MGLLPLAKVCYLSSARLFNVKEILFVFKEHLKKKRASPFKCKSDEMSISPCKETKNECNENKPRIC
jgi:hypothetical protein